MLPCFRDAFEGLEQWTQEDKAPPNSHLVHRDPAVDLVNTCRL
jgi:hypothetical protein